MTDHDGWEFRIGQSKRRHGLVVGGACGVVGLALLLGGESVAEQRWLGGLIAVLGVGVAWHGLRVGRDRGPHLRIDRDGVFFREWGLTVAWRDIEDVYQSGSRVQPFVTVRLRDPARFQARLAAAEARALKGNRLWKSPELRIPYNAVEATRDEILAALEAGRRAFGGSE